MGSSKTKRVSQTWHVLKVHHWVYTSAIRLQQQIASVGTEAAAAALREPKHCPFCRPAKLKRVKGLLRCPRCGLSVPLEAGLPTLTTLFGLGILGIAKEVPQKKRRT